MDQSQYNSLYEIRKQYGGTFITAFHDGLIIPWKPLSLKDYIKISEDRDKGIIPISRLEDEIFTSCVLDKLLVKQIDFLKAGTVHTVVMNIWEYSGPANAQQFSSDINTSRNIFYSSKYFVIHELVSIITMAFPYKPEEIYEMNYETFLTRVIQAEKKLLALGIYLQEPITIEFKDQSTESVEEVKEKKQQIDAKKIWEESQNNKVIQKQEQKQEPQNKKWWKVSPVLESKGKHGIDFKLESKEQLLASTGHEKLNANVDRIKLVEDARIIYKDLLEELEKRRNKKQG